MSRPRHRRFARMESLEDRRLLAVGPLIHTHNSSQLAVVDAGSGQMESIAPLAGYFQNDGAMADIAFDPEGRLFGVTSSRLYEIHPVTGRLTHLGLHEVPNANAMVFDSDGRLLVMGRTNSEVFEITFDTEVRRVEIWATLSGIEAGDGANGDISILGPDLVVATTDNRLVFYRSDVNPGRPRIVKEYELDSVDVDDVFGLAVDEHQQLVGTTRSGVVKFDVSNPTILSAEIFDVSDEDFGDLRGAAHYAEAGGPVPIGTVAGTKWHDLDGNGIQQLTEPVLTSWQVYIDTNVNGQFDVGEPNQTTDEHGRYYFFGLEPGMYTVDEVILDPTEWEQTFPQSPHRNLAATYSFDSITASNQLFHDFGLPGLTTSFVNIGGNGSAVLLNGRSFLELPVALGQESFTIAIDATYSPFASDQHLISQRAAPENDARDFELLARSDSQLAVGQFCDGAGQCVETISGNVLSTRSNYGLTWDGNQIGAFSDEALVLESVSGSRPDIDGETVRFGDPTAATVRSALQGVLHEIRIYNAALTETELINAFSASAEPNAYTVYIDDTRGADGIDFGNREPVIVELAPEIEVRRGSEAGELIVNNATVSLGEAASIDDAPSVQFFVHNLGTSDLQLPDADVTDGFEITGDLVSTVQPGDFTSMVVTLTDRTPGEKTGVLTIQNNDADESPFVINLTTELIDLDLRPRQMLVNTTSGRLLRIDRVSGAVDTLMSNLPELTDIAHHPQDDRLLGIDATRLYELDISNDAAMPLFTHGIPNATGLAFSPIGELFAASQDVHRIDLAGQTSTPFATGGDGEAGDLAFVGTQMYLSTSGGNLYEVREGQSNLIGDSGNLTLTGLVGVDADSLFGFSANQTFEVNTDTGAVSPQFNSFIFSIAGATFQPAIVAHNERNPFDVNDDGFVVPFDALLVINEMNDPQFTDPITQRILSPPIGDAKFPDVNNDGFVSPVDALLIINFLNEQAAGGPAAAKATVPTVDVALETLDSGIDTPLLNALAESRDDDLRRQRSR